VTLDLDLKGAGLQVGVAAIDFSDDAHAYGVIPVPVAMIAGGHGPTVLMTGGTHGDEWEGQLLARRIIRTLGPADVHGRLIVLPALNQPAVLAARRISPVDGGNLNRAFPGDPDGGPTAILADFVERELLPQSDFAVDLHSGGAASRYLPCAFLRIDGDAALTGQKVAGADAFGLPATVVVAAAGESRTLSAAADRQGVVMVAAELSGGSAVDVDVLAEAEAALGRLLAHWRILEPPAASGPTAPTTFLRLAAHVTVPFDGLLEPVARLGDVVREGDLLARAHRLDDLNAVPVDLRAPVGGVVAIARVPVRVQAGSHACTIGTPLSRADVTSLGSADGNSR
jgi:predicted deacylase